MSTAATPEPDAARPSAASGALPTRDRAIGVTCALLLRIVPGARRADPARAGRTALILGVAALVLCVVFWTGLAIAVGAGALALGLSLREAPGAESVRGKATATVVLGAIAVVGSFVVLLVG
jgi:hypothetical protein